MSCSNLAEFKAAQVTTASLADVLNGNGDAFLGPLFSTGALSYILTTGDAVGGCDYSVFATNEDPSSVASPHWAPVLNSSGSAAAGTVAASTTAVIFDVDHAHHTAYKVQVKYHTSANAQSVTLIGVAKG
jgi:hypothetical protein